MCFFTRVYADLFASRAMFVETNFEDEMILYFLIVFYSRGQFSTNKKR